MPQAVFRRRSPLWCLPEIKGKTFSCCLVLNLADQTVKQKKVLANARLLRLLYCCIALLRPRIRCLLPKVLREEKRGNIGKSEKGLSYRGLTSDRREELRRVELLFGIIKREG